MSQNRGWTSIFVPLLVLGLLGIPAARAEQPDLRPELSPLGRLGDLTVAPSGDLWFGTAMGHAYVSRDGNRSWQEVEVTERRIPPEEFFGDQLSLVRFFDERRGFFAGYVGEKQNLILRTSDGGATWVKTVLSRGSWARVET